MILLSSPLKNEPPGNHGKPIFSLEIEIVTTKIVNSKSLKTICRQLLSTMNVLNMLEKPSFGIIRHQEPITANCSVTKTTPLCNSPHCVVFTMGDFLL